MVKVVEKKKNREHSNNFDREPTEQASQSMLNKVCDIGSPAICDILKLKAIKYLSYVLQFFN